MDEQNTHNLALLIRDADTLAQALNISDCSPDLQLKIMSEWSSLLLKRLLLRIPADHTAEVQKMVSEMHAAEKDSGEFIDALAEYIPDFERSLDEEIERALNDFRLIKA